MQHEIVHTLGFYKELYEADPVTGTGSYVGNLVDGINAQTGQETKAAFSVMGTDRGTFSDTWIDPESYGIAFDTLTKPLIDPEILVISGLVNKNGTFTPLATQILPEGDLTPNFGGSLKVEAVNAQGSVISSVSVQPIFKGLISYGPSAKNFTSDVAAESFPVVVALPYSRDVQQVRVSLAGKLIHSSEPKSKALQDAIDSIPDLGFKACAHLSYLAKEKNKLKLIEQCGDIERKVLTVKVEAIAKILKSKNARAAKAYFGFLRLEVERRVIDFEPIDALGATKEEIIDMLDRLQEEL